MVGGPKSVWDRQPLLAAPVGQTVECKLLTLLFETFESLLLPLVFSSRRFESLDDLDSLRQPSPSSCAAFAYPRPHSAAAGYCAPSRNSSSRYSTGAILPRRPATADCSHNGRFVSHAVTPVRLLLVFFSSSFFTFWPHTAHLCCPRMVTGRRTCCVCERVLASGAAMVIEALSLCFHLACFQVRGRDWVAVAAVDHCLSRLRKGCLRRKACLQPFIT